MARAVVTYNAPSGDDKIVTMCGVELFDGYPTEVDITEKALTTFWENKFFDVVTEVDGITPPPKRRGRPPKVVDPVTIENIESEEVIPAPENP